MNQAVDFHFTPSCSATLLPQVSVIVPIYNGAADLPDLLHCLQLQTYPADRVEYLLIDNGSTDQTLNQLQILTANLQAPTGAPLTFRILTEPHIQSSYAARNQGICLSSGEILAFTDADCRPHPNWLEHIIQPFVDTEIAIVAGEILALSGNTLLERYADRHKVLSQEHTLAHPFYPYGQTANLAIRRQALEQVGLFRPHLTTGGDADLCWRIQQQHVGRICFVEQAIVRHRHRSTFADLQSQWQRYGRSNRYLHQLHGIELGKAFTQRELLYRWIRWFCKEVPAALLQTKLDRETGGTLIDRLIDTPLSLFCQSARVTGQQQASLPEQADRIDWLPNHACHSNCRSD
ncbi:MAG TPA: glycosyltransferase [Trichocoleus sp.]|jgi:glycosyltransferase involved in cell wall biosynthesis